MSRRGRRLILTMAYIKLTNPTYSYKSIDITESQITEFKNYKSGSASEPSWLESLEYEELTKGTYSTLGMFFPEKTNDCTFELIED